MQEWLRRTAGLGADELERVLTVLEQPLAHGKDAGSAEVSAKGHRSRGRPRRDGTLAGSPRSASAPTPRVAESGRSGSSADSPASSLVDPPVDPREKAGDHDVDPGSATTDSAVTS